MSEVTLVSTSVTGSTMGTLTKRIEQEIHRASSQDQAAIKMAIITAMEWFKQFPFHFNQGTAQLDLTVGQEAYGVATASTEGWPTDMISPVDVYVQTGGTRWLSMSQITFQNQRWLQPTSTVTGLPTSWAWYDHQIWLTPVPSEANLVLRIDYLKDLGIPRYAWNGTSWQFYLPESNAEMLDTYSNDWIVYAEELIRQRAKWDLYFNYFDDAENAQKMFDATQVTLGNVRSKSEAKTRSVGRVPTPI